MRVSLAQVESDLKSWLAAHIPPEIGGRVQYPNAPFTTPTNQSWIRATLSSPVRIDRDASNCLRIYQGFFYIDVFYPKKIGSLAPMQTAENLALVFDGAEMPYTVCLNAEVDVIGSEDDTPWYHVQVICQYQYQSITGA